MKSALSLFMTVCSNPNRGFFLRFFVERDINSERGERGWISSSFYFPVVSESVLTVFWRGFAAKVLTQMDFVLLSRVFEFIPAIRIHFGLFLV